MPSIVLKYGCASQSSVLVNSRCTSSPPYTPGGRLMECTTTRSTAAPSGRGPKFGEASLRAKRYQPASHRLAPSGTGRVIGLFAARRGDRQPRDAVADLAQAQAQSLGGRGAVEVGLAQRLHQDL